jgi:hypothetical protein
MSITRLSTLAISAIFGFAVSANVFAAGPTKTLGHVTSTTTKVAANVIKLDVKEVDGKKIWSPAAATTKVNEPVTVEAHNSLSAPHGLKIEGFVPETVIGAGETKSFTFTPTKKGDLKVHCHLHPAHVDSVIKVQ